MSASSYTPLSPKFALQLAAPHTWPAAVLPCLGAVCFAGVYQGYISWTLTLALLAICVLFQAAANTMNDYFDYIKGADTADDNVEDTDSTLVYNNINPKSVLVLGLVFIAVAFLLGIYIIIRSGFIPLAIGVVGAVVVVLYSAGKTPLSYLPLGELVSGVFFGLMIPIAVYYSLTQSFTWWLLLWCMPYIIGVGLIMLTNNTCDIEKDTLSGRHTLPMTLGRTGACKLYKASLLAWLLFIVIATVLSFPTGIIIIPFMLLSVWPMIKPLMHNPFLPTTRIRGMSQILSLNIALGAFYAVIIVLSGTFTLVL